jgi:uncharacterized protein YjbI with pentapeptide repeats
VPSKDTVRWPAAPRVDGSLGPPPGPLDDAVSWSGVGAGPDVSFSGTACDYEIVGSRLHGVRLTGAVLESGRWLDVIADDCELSGLVLEEATLVRVVFQRCRMSGAVVTGMKGQDLRFVDCRLDGSNFRGASLERCAFEDCDLTGADFYGAKFAPGALRRCRLRGVEFSKAACEGLDLRGSDLDGLTGAISLRHCIISPEQTVPLGLALLSTLDVTVRDDDDQPR